MIAAIGIALVDHVMLVDGFNGTEGSYYTDRYVVEGGGMAATALCAASKLGSRTRLFSRIGDDVNGQFILNGLAEFDVDTSGIAVLPGRCSTAAFVLVDQASGEKQFYSERTKDVFMGTVPLKTEDLDEAQVLLVDGHWIDGALMGVRYARERRIPVVADFKRFYDGLDVLFPYIDYFIVPEFFARELTGEIQIEKVLEALTDIQPGLPVVTRGSEGGVYLDPDGIHTYRSYDIDTIDSTGAGDAFHGAFCHFLSLGHDIGTCLSRASAVGALNCRDIGGRRALPSPEELERFLAGPGNAPQNGSE